jgi:hypothetical protein
MFKQLTVWFQAADREKQRSREDEPAPEVVGRREKSSKCVVQSAFCVRQLLTLSLSGEENSTGEQSAG